MENTAYSIGEPKKSHIAICGTGRAGTTLLVRILHSAGLETGFSDQQLDETLNHISRAGLERYSSRENAANLPDVIKSPSLYEWASSGLRDKWLKIDHMIVPIRDIDQVLSSRFRVTSRTFHEYFSKGMLRGGFVGGPTKIFKQREATLELFFQNVLLAVDHGIPLTFISFPRFVHDVDYFIEILGPTLKGNRDVDPSVLRQAHQDECRPDLVRGKK